jgi:hypothetical protein
MGDHKAQENNSRDAIDLIKKYDLFNKFSNKMISMSAYFYVDLLLT